MSKRDDALTQARRFLARLDEDGSKFADTFGANLSLGVVLDGYSRWTYSRVLRELHRTGEIEARTI